MPMLAPYRYYSFLSMLFMTIVLSTYLLAYKMVAIGSFLESGSAFIFPLVYAIADISAEVYGYKATKKLVQQALCCCLVFSIITPLIAWLPAPTHWPHQESYHYLLKNVLRFFIASAIGLMLGIAINGYLICYWQRILQGRHFWLRSLGSTAIGQFTTSLITDGIAFAGMMPFFMQIKLMVAIYLVKLIYAILLAWPCSLLVTHLKIREGIDFYRCEYAVNPFRK